MRFSPHFLLGMAALALQVALAPAADPAALELLGPPPAAEVVPQSSCLAADDGAIAARGGVIAGVGLYLIQPYFEGNLAYAVEVENQNPNPPFPPPGGTFHVLDRVDVRHRVQAAPLAWLGYVGESGLGGRGRYWYFRAGTDQTLTFPASTGPLLVTVFSATPLGLEGFGDTLFQPVPPPAPGLPEPTAVAITSKLEVQVGDLEVLQEFRAGRWELLVAGGLRLARLVQSYDFYNLQPIAVPVVTRALLSSYHFQGAGPVLALEARRPLGETAVSLYGSARGALVFGNAQQNSTFGGTTLRNLDANPQVGRERRERGLPIVEFELGLEYGRDVGGSHVFGQVALVGQDWLGAGNATRSAANTFREGALIGGTDADSDLAFFGLSFRLGVNF
jgi:hypothetical protein